MTSLQASFLKAGLAFLREKHSFSGIFTGPGNLFQAAASNVNSCNTWQPKIDPPVRRVSVLAGKPVDHFFFGAGGVQESKSNLLFTIPPMALLLSKQIQMGRSTKACAIVFQRKAELGYG